MSVFRRLSRCVLFVIVSVNLFAQADQNQQDNGPASARDHVDLVPYNAGRWSVSPISSKTSDKKYSLSGSVVNSVTGEGIPRALVQINGAIVTLADANGNFTFEGLAAGRYYVAVRKPGYFSRQEAMMEGSPPEAIEVGPEAHSATLKLMPEALVSGHVTDSDGLPVQHLPVQCMKLTVMDGRKQWQSSGAADTDEDGYYRMSDLTPGTYKIVAGPSQFPALGAMAKTGKQLAGYGAAYYPGADDGGTTGGTRITAGQKLTVDLSVDAEPFYSVTGSVLGPPGAAQVVMLTRKGLGRSSPYGARVRPDTGVFELRMVAAGDYTLGARGQFEGKPLTSSMPLHVAGDIAGLQVPLDPGITIPIRFDVQRTKTDSPIVFRGGFRTGSTVQMPMMVSLQSTDEEQGQAGPTPLPDDPKAFGFQNVQPGTYLVNYNPFGDLYVASARFGTTDLLREKLAVAKSTGQSIDIVLRDDGGNLNGTITSGDHGVGGFLVLVPENGSPRLEQRSSEKGQFALRQLRPGSYSILAFDTISDLEYSNPEALEPYMSHAAHIDVTANQEATVTVELIKRGEE